MRRETFDTPGPLVLNVRVPTGEVDLQTVDGDETVVELSAGPEIEEEARIELHPKRDGHEVSVVIEKRSGLFGSFRDDMRVRITRSAGSGGRALDGLGRRRGARRLRRREGEHGLRRHQPSSTSAARRRSTRRAATSSSTGSTARSP